MLILNLMCSMFCDITTILGTNHGLVCSLHNRDVETRILQHTNTENGLFCEVGDVLHPTVKLMQMFFILNLWTIEFFYEGEGVGIIF